MEKKDPDGGDPRDDRADAGDGDEQLSIHGIVQNFGIHVVFVVGRTRIQM